MISFCCQDAVDYPLEIECGRHEFHYCPDCFKMLSGKDYEEFYNYRWKHDPTPGSFYITIYINGGQRSDYCGRKLFLSAEDFCSFFSRELYIKLMKGDAI